MSTVLYTFPAEQTSAGQACRSFGHVWPSGLRAETFATGEFPAEACARCGTRRERQ